MNSIVPSIFGRIFSNKIPLAFNEHALAVTHNKTNQQIQWSEVTTPLSFKFGFLGQTIHFSTADQNVTLTMMGYHSDHFLKTRFDQYWVNANIAKLDALLEKIANILSHGFLRQSRISDIKSLALQERSRWFPWIKESNSLALIEKKIQLLDKYSKWDNVATHFFQHRYVKEQLQHHTSFFDRVESNPLTERQRIACIIDDDNNLLLAGAGTGKTSVMIARAGYLVQSQQAKYDDILLLAYGRKAADEMNQRIQDKLTTDKIKAATFHSLGLSIISQVEGGRPSLSVFAEDEKVKAEWLHNSFESLIENQSEYRARVLDYFSQYYYVEKNDFDFQTLGDYYHYLNDNDILSLKGDKVKSFGELYIANWLFYHGIDYEYAAAYQFDVKTLARRQYKPDFYLPEYELYIEYYGVDEAGNTAPYIDKDQYHASIAWKKATHQRYNTRCVTLTYAQHKRDTLLDELQNALSEHKIDYEILPIESILASLKETGRISILAELFGKLLGLYKAADLDEKAQIDIINRAEDTKQAETALALALLKPIMSSYNHHLHQRDEVDFEDMIIKAIDYVESGLFTSPWRCIMVDEFQDISKPRARLVKALRDNHNGSSVFAVGDDWQAIYRFSGADIRLTTQFAKYFGLTTQTELDVTFRFNNKIGQVASDFISKNPAQLHKTITSLTRVATPAISLLRRGDHTVANYQSSLIELSNGAVDDVLQAIYSKTCKPVTVYLLARFGFTLPSHVDIQTLSAKYPLLKMQAHTFHAAKGKEADYVVIIGLQKGKHGFPSEKATPAILDALLPPQEDYPYAEERRLFYVALTRARHRVYIIADMANTSGFVQELMAEHDLELDEFSSENEQVYTDDINCMRCDTGVLKKQTGRYGIFYCCSLFPRCRHKEQPCQQCSSPMTRKRHTGFKLCLDTNCNHIIPICDKCDAEMVLRKGPKGDFWGCRNFKGDEALSCKNGRDPASIQWPELES
jgi:DNA helicase-4